MAARVRVATPPLKLADPTREARSGKRGGKTRRSEERCRPRDERQRVSESRKPEPSGTRGVLPGLRRAPPHDPRQGGVRKSDERPGALQIKPAGKAGRHRCLVGQVINPARTNLERLDMRAKMAGISKAPLEGGHRARRRAAEVTSR